jgi:hypothetical protein
VVIWYTAVQLDPLRQKGDKTRSHFICPTTSQADFRKAKEKVLYKKKEGVPEGLYM